MTEPETNREIFSNRLGLGLALIVSVIILNVPSIVLHLVDRNTGLVFVILTLAFWTAVFLLIYCVYAFRIVIDDHAMELKYPLSLWRNRRVQWDDAEALELHESKDARGQIATDIQFRLKNGNVIKFPSGLVDTARLMKWAKHNLALIEIQRLGHCVKCGYILKGNTSGICPECGHVVGLGQNIEGDIDSHTEAESDTE